MTGRADDVDIEAWDGAIGPQSGNDPGFFEIEFSDDGSVLLTGRGPGMLRSYGRARFEALVADGEWVLADEDRARRVYVTEDGERPF